MSSVFVPGRRSLLIGGAALAATGLAASQRSGADARQTTTEPCAVELFTSQGCSSCPPADAVLGQLARRPDIVALSYHVDYWDYIGWKDPFATAETTERQREYARTLKQRYVYTPEMVVDGYTHDPGVDRGKVDTLLGKAQRRLARRATPELTRAKDGVLTVRLAAYPLQGQTVEVMLAIYDRRHSTPVPRGENSGRMLENFNVVRHLETLDHWNGSEKSWTVPAGRLAVGQGVAVLVQEGDCGPMFGCNKLEPMVTG